jgi:hypothetical protein
MEKLKYTAEEIATVQTYYPLAQGVRRAEAGAGQTAQGAGA